MKNENIQFTGVATATVSNGNGNGNGHKSVETTKAETVTAENHSNSNLSFELKMENSRKFYPQQLENVKLLCEGILADCEYKESAIDALMVIFTVFSNIARKQPLIDVVQLSEDLNFFLYSQTFNFSDSTESYLETLLNGKKYPNSKINHDLFTLPAGTEDDSKVKEAEESKETDLAKSLSSVPESAESGISNRLAQHRLQIIANQVACILASDEVSDDMKNSFDRIIFNAGNEVGMAVSDPDLIRIAFPKIINSLDFNFGRGTVSAIESLIDGFLGTEFYENCLAQYEKRFDDKAEKEDRTEKGDLATHLAAILNDPATPSGLYNAISDELSTLYNGQEITKTINSEEFLRRSLANPEMGIAV